MADSSLNSSKSFDLNDSDIEKEFAKIKTSTAGRQGPPGNMQAAQGSAKTPLASAMKKSPKPIPKGIDFGENLIGNPKYFSKNNTPLVNSDDARYSDNIMNSSDVVSPSGHGSRDENWTRMNSNHNLHRSDSGYTHDDKDEENITEEYDDINTDDDENLMSSQSGSRLNEKNTGAHNYNLPNHRAGMNSNVEYNKYQNMTQNEIYAAKEEILLELEKLEDKGVRVDKKFSISSDLYEMERTYMRLKTKRDQTSAIKLMKKVLMGLVSGTEYINQKFNKNNIDLEGWAENVLLNITDYDEIFEELYDKYKTKFAVAPEIKLFMTLIGSAFTFHMSKVLASKFSASPFGATSQSSSPAAQPHAREPAPAAAQSARGAPAMSGQQQPFFGSAPGAQAGGAAKRNIELSRNMSSIFGPESKKVQKNNDELDEIIKEMEKNTNALEIPNEDDQEFNEILSDDNNPEYSGLDEIQPPKKKSIAL
jgi:hypothetical protein